MIFSDVVFGAVARSEYHLRSDFAYKFSESRIIYMVTGKIADFRNSVFVQGILRSRCTLKGEGVDFPGIWKAVKTLR